MGILLLQHLVLTVLINFSGAKFIGVPGEIMAFWKAHQKYGKLPWKMLFTPTIKLADDGHHVSHSLARALGFMKPIMHNYPGFW